MKSELDDLPIIDAHVHLWDISQMQYPWLDSEPTIKRSFFVNDYQEQTRDFQIEKMVFVQGDCLPDQSLNEVNFAIKQAALDTRIQAIIAYAPLEKGGLIKNLLQLYQTTPLVKGVRKMYDADPSLCSSTAFLDAVSLLPEYDLSFDLSIRPTSVGETLKMIKQCPQTQFVLAHLAKPDIKNGGYLQFQRDIEAFASLPNVVAKISGLITEANRELWVAEEITPYINYAIDCFGCNRLMYGGDWPVVLLAGAYARWLEVVFNCVQNHSKKNLHKFFYGTAQRIYRI